MSPEEKEKIREELKKEVEDTKASLLKKPLPQTNPQTNAYYCESNGMAIQKILDNMLDSEKSAIIDCKLLRLTTKSALNRIYAGWKWLIDNRDEDGKYRNLKSRIRLQVLAGSIISFTWIKEVFDFQAVYVPARELELSDDQKKLIQEKLTEKLYNLDAEKTKKQKLADGQKTTSDTVFIDEFMGKLENFYNTAGSNDVFIEKELFLLPEEISQYENIFVDLFGQNGNQFRWEIKPNLIKLVKL